MTIRPGIYRKELLGNFYGLYNELYDEQDLSREQREAIPAIDETPIKERIERVATRFGLDNPYVFQPVERFFRTWSEGYDEGATPQGFELYYTNWIRGTPHFEVGRWTGIDFLGRPDSILIAVDHNRICDIRDRMALGVNDFDKERVLAYQEVPEFFQQQAFGRLLKPRELQPDRNPYSFPSQSVDFPWDSVNVLKAHDSAWTAMHVTPAEIYDGLRDVGVIFPD